MMRMVVVFVWQVLHRPIASHPLTVRAEHRVKKWPGHILVMVLSEWFGADVDEQLSIALLNIDAALLRELSRGRYTNDIQKPCRGCDADNSPLGHALNLSGAKKGSMENPCSQERLNSLLRRRGLRTDSDLRSNRRAFS